MISDGEEEEQHFFEVEYIKDARAWNPNNPNQYLVVKIKWMGYNQPEDDTWEPWDNLNPDTALYFLRDYRQKLGIQDMNEKLKKKKLGLVQQMISKWKEEHRKEGKKFDDSEEMSKEAIDTTKKISQEEAKKKQLEEKKQQEEKSRQQKEIEALNALKKAKESRTNSTSKPDKHIFSKPFPKPPSQINRERSFEYKKPSTTPKNRPERAERAHPPIIPVPVPPPKGPRAPPLERPPPSVSPSSPALPHGSSSSAPFLSSSLSVDPSSIPLFPQGKRPLPSDKMVEKKRLFEEELRQLEVNVGIVKQYVDIYTLIGVIGGKGRHNW